MPQVGEIKTGKELGRRGTYKFEWRRCPICEVERYVRQECKGALCHKCSCGISQSNRGKVQPEGTMRDGSFIGEVVHGRDIGKLPKNGKFLWQPCQWCQGLRWVAPSANNKLCDACGHKQAALTRHAPSRLNDREMKHSTEAGRKGDHMLYKDNCPGCGGELWREKHELGLDCNKCFIKDWSGAKHPRWKGGRQMRGKYVYLTLQPDHPYYSMADPKSHRVQEHRVVMAELLGRSLKPWEVVHHINRIKDDNRPENLMLLPSKKEHTAWTRQEQHIDKLERTIDGLAKRITILEAENVALIHDEELRRLW